MIWEEQKKLAKQALAAERKHSARHEFGRSEVGRCLNAVHWRKHLYSRSTPPGSRCTVHRWVCLAALSKSHTAGCENLKVEDFKALCGWLGMQILVRRQYQQQDALVLQTWPRQSVGHGWLRQGLILSHDK